MIHTSTILTTFQKPFFSSHPKNVICTSHTMSCYELNKHTRTFSTSSSNTVTLLIHQHDNFTIDINTLILNTPHHFFLNSPIVLKTLTYKASSEKRFHYPDVYLQSPNQTLKGRRIPPTEVPILEFIYNTRYNRKLLNFIQNTPYELSPSTKEHNIIKVLELLWPLLQNKHIIRLLANY